MPLLTELNHIFLGVSINMTLLTELGVLKHYGLGNVTPERPCAKRVAVGGKVRPVRSLTVAVLMGAPANH